MPRVWVYPERCYEQLGATRWLLTWEELRPSAKDKEEIDYDLDILHCGHAFLTRDLAMEDGRKMVDAGKTLFGQATVREQRVGWFEELDGVAEWIDVGREEYVD